MSGHIAVVGGGLGGLTTALILARAGRAVTLFEKNQFIGGRAVTDQHQGFRFNLGPHALFRRGQAARVLAELGIPIDGGMPRAQGIAIDRGRMARFPGDLFSLLTTSLLSIRGKIEIAEFLAGLRRLRPEPWGPVAVADWLDEYFPDRGARQLVEALVRLATYAHAPAELSASVAIAQLQLALHGNVIYVHDGWQRLVDAVHSAAVSAGVNFVTSARVVRVVHDGEVRGIELGGLEDSSDQTHGTSVHTDVVVLAVDPRTANGLLLGADASTRRWNDASPVLVSCLDVALSSLPQPKNLFALGIDEPVYFSVPSAWAHLAPKGGALIHLAKYLSDEHASQEAEGQLERLLDQLQPGWRDRLVHRRFLPRLTVSNALVSARRGGFSGRPDVNVPDIRNLYIAGDWVGSEGLLSDAVLASARRAAQLILES